MPSVRLNVELRDKLLSSASELFGALGVELTSEQQAEMAHRKAYRAKREQQKREYYEAHRAEILERAKARAKERKEEIRAYQVAYRAAHREQAQEYREKHREKARAVARENYRKHYEGRREEMNAKRRAQYAAKKATLPNPEKRDNVEQIGTIRAAENPKKGENG